MYAGKTLFAQVGIPRPPLGNGKERMGFDQSQIHAWDVVTGKERMAGNPGGMNMTLWGRPARSSSTTNAPLSSVSVAAPMGVHFCSWPLT